jgi:hypothetical protein
MSYDLLVFEAGVPPNESRAFMAWYREFTEWREGHDYDNPANTSETLRAWYNDMRADFPAMNGPDAVGDDTDTDKIAGYTCANGAIYTDFRWSAAEAAHKASFELAKKHGLGFWDVSFSKEVWGPTSDGSYEMWFEINLND